MIKNNDIFDYFDEKRKEDKLFNLECTVEENKLQLAEMLRDYRKSLNISQEELAMRSGLTRQMVSKVETYTSTPTLTTLFKYLNGLEINLNELLLNKLYNSSRNS